VVGPMTGGENSPPRSLALVSLWRAKWAILAVIALVFVVGYQYSKDQSATYEAKSRIVLSAAQPFDPLGTYSFSDPTRYVADQVAIIDTQAVLAPAAQQLSVATPPDVIDPVELARAIEAEPAAVNSVITVTATAPSPEQAVARVNTVAAAYEAYLANQISVTTEGAVAATAANPDVVQDIRGKAAAFGDGVAVVENAAPGSTTSSLNPLRNALLITAVAALLAIGLALLWRTPPPDGSAVLKAAGARLLGRVPGWRLGGLQEKDYAHTWVALDYARRGLPGPVLLTGAGRRSGTAAVAQGVASSAAASGHRVLLVDADPERRELLGRLGARPTRSLEDVDRPGVTEEEVLVPVGPQTAGGGQVFLAKVGVDGSAAVDAAAAGDALGRLARSHGTVLLQSAPVTASPVAFALVDHVSAVVAVARGADRPRALTALRDRLDVARRPLVGVILTGRHRAGVYQPQQQQPQGDPAPPESRPSPAAAPEFTGSTR
jgi:capsular polysaccharide biosynthesis protein